MDSILQRLAEFDEIISAILIGKDGLIVAGTVQSEEDELLGATSAAVFGSITQFTSQASNSEARHAIIETETGTVQFAEVGELILVVSTKGIGNMGRVRLEMKKACQQLADLVAAY
ncbi:MAG TPA: roadblock/LC7 domain-containing protein [Ktedonobacteraceae bacterium]|jgi:predicted regulator of Ras-like GTPase activity (Roadblock/LC7/MglB family)|nr:roadblock/LC7 domain-containing protein [Ktedonobacteraceae bacterium]